MNNHDHCRAVRVLLGQAPHAGLHAFMDDYSKQLGWGHRLLRHNFNMIELAEDTYGPDGGREVALHIACDMGIITNGDVTQFQRRR